MKLINSLIALLAPLALLACGDDSSDNNGDSSSSGNSSTVTLTSSSPANGETDVPISTTSIQLTYSAEVNFVSGQNADFNGTQCSMTAFSKKANVMTFSIPSTLKMGEQYTLSIPAGFFISTNGSTPVPAHSVTFTTKAQTTIPVEGLAQSLVTSDPLPQAKAIYDYLLSVYGQKTLSASMANVSWNLNEANLVFQATGKYPAIATMDYIHLYTNRSDWTNKYWVVNYHLTDEIRQWVADGGILAASWHWMVPAYQGADPTADGSMTTSPDDTSFKPSNMFIDGTWEKSVHDEDLALMADRLLELQNEGIALIWRPFHEASGNVNSGGSAWFWWGREGAEVYKQVWIDMFNYFKDKGIRNLIWVWTTQTGYGWDATKGILADTDWYPGDEYVDIIGRDEYNTSLDASVAEYKAIVENFPNKMVTLSECGNVAKLSQQFTQGATWSYCMPWYKYDATTLDGHDHANTEWWNDAMSCEYVVSRDQLPKFE